jgi:glycerol uptake facilitator-like aquaporin
MTTDPRRRAAAEAVGTLLLVATVIGSGIMADELAAGPALGLLANTLATGAGLVALILAFGPISGAHFNPLVTLAAKTERLPWRAVAGCIAAQFAGAVGGAAVAHAMFGLPAFRASRHARTGPAQWFAELVATFGLLLVIGCVGRSRPAAAPFAVAAWITAAYWFTASTSFANPAVTVARACSDTFAGIRPGDVPAFVAAQVLGAFLGVGFCRWLRPAENA